MGCPAKGSFTEILHGHQWAGGEVDTSELLLSQDLQPMELRWEMTCRKCNARCDMWITDELLVFKAMIVCWEEPDRPLYFRRSGTTLRRCGEDEYTFGWGDEFESQCHVCGYNPGALDVGLTRMCTVCWGAVKWWLNVVADPRAELEEADEATTHDTRLKIRTAHLSGVIEAKLRTDPQLAADMKAADADIRAGIPVQLKHFQERLDAIELDIPDPVFYVVQAVREAE